MEKQTFLAMFAPCAMEDMKISGVLASVTIAQAILESGWGESPLVANGNNYFGMKCSLSGNTWDSVWDGVSRCSKQTKEQDKAGNESTIVADFRAYPDMLTSIRDHSCYLVGAMKGTKRRYEGLVGETDPRTAITIIKEGEYATDVDYVNKIMNIITSNNLTQYDVIEKGEISVNIVESYATKNRCYQQNNKFSPAPQGCMLHSVGCPQPNANVFVKNWNTPDVSVCVHLVIGADGIAYQILPFGQKGWHSGSGTKGSANQTHIGMEMTEPATIKYTSGSNWIETGDGSNTKAHVLATYRHAVEVFAYLCKLHNLDPERDGVVISHSEGNKRGIASNHGDVEHLWRFFGLTMNQFRADVKAAMAGADITTVPKDKVDNSSDDTSSQAVNPLAGTVTVIYEGDDGLNIRKAPSILADIDHVVGKGEVFTVVGISADEKWYKLKSGLFISTIPSYVKFKATEEQKASTAGTGYFRVRESWNDADSQIGAFKDKNNAINLCKQNVGYKVYDDSGVEIYPCVTVPADKPFLFKVTIPDLRIRKGAGTGFDYWKDNGKARYTGENTLTIVKTKDGQGAKLWGLLKAYADNEDGWIALDEAYGHRVD